MIQGRYLINPGTRVSGKLSASIISRRSEQNNTTQIDSNPKLIKISEKCPDSDNHSPERIINKLSLFRKSVITVIN